MTRSSRLARAGGGAASGRKCRPRALGSSIVAGPTLPAPQLTLSPDDVRLTTLRAQGFVGARARRGGVPAMLRRVGAVQLDTISVLARSHELVAYSRLGP